MSFVTEGKIALQSGDYKKLGKLIYESHQLKKELNQDKFLPNSPISDVEELLKNSSIYGYKLLGAGGGGFFLVIGKERDCKQYLNSVGLDPLPIEIDNKGCIVFNTLSSE